jgi:hypothetical protein
MTDEEKMLKAPLTCTGNRTDDFVRAEYGEEFSEHLRQEGVDPGDAPDLLERLCSEELVKFTNLLRTHFRATPEGARALRRGSLP